MGQDVIIEVNNLWKRYGLPPSTDLKGVLNNIKHGRPLFSVDNEIGPWSLRDISFQLKKGEVLGVIGRNGAGKSTLLKVLAGVSPATKGSVSIRGRVFPMIELAAGMHLDLTGRENVRLLGAVMGIPRGEMEACVPKIEEFCELGEWFDRPVYQYSSGMMARLGFGVAMNIDADILLVDEVLSVGDFIFQKKAINKMTSLINSGVTVILVSHSPYMVERICNKALLFDHGRLALSGDPTEVFNQYYLLGNRNERVESRENQDPCNRPGTGDIRIEKIDVLNSANMVVTECVTGDRVKMKIFYNAKEEVANPNFGVSFTDGSNTILFYETNIEERGSWHIKKGKGVIQAEFDLSLMPGHYSINTMLSSGLYKYDIWTDAKVITVVAPPELIHKNSGLGIFHCPIRWTLNP